MCLYPVAFFNQCLIFSVEESVEKLVSCGENAWSYFLDLCLHRVFLNLELQIYHRRGQQSVFTRSRGRKVVFVV